MCNTCWLANLAAQVLDMYFAVVFGLEAIIKIVMCGFLFNGRGSYMRSPWNVLDLFIVVIQVCVSGKRSC
jgi:hypothetical protein